ncbi:hypothetical protein [Micromonospora sp. CP22]|uniref:hypothetical protein n=1 Tax=Micromonospora sp. CP22 TaxID=2580517 RepID=UPI0012BB91AC|nr:hypothetical protein [Micromonospora sp. CP22]
MADVFFLSEVPGYPAGSDPQNIEYAYQQPGSDERLLNPQEIRRASECAADYPA